MKKQALCLGGVIACAVLAGVCVALPIDAVINDRHYPWYWSLPLAILVVGLLVGAIFLAVKTNRLWHDNATATGVTHTKKDIVLTKGTTYTVADDKKAVLTAGTYLILAVDETVRSFNLRVNDRVREYRHNTKLVLTVGDTIAAVSGNVILRQI